MRPDSFANSGPWTQVGLTFATGAAAGLRCLPAHPGCRRGRLGGCSTFSTTVSTGSTPLRWLGCSARRRSCCTMCCPAWHASQQARLRLRCGRNPSIDPINRRPLKPAFWRGLPALTEGHRHDRQGRHLVLLGRPHPRHAASGRCRRPPDLRRRRPRHRAGAGRPLHVVAGQWTRSRPGAVPQSQGAGTPVLEGTACLARLHLDRAVLLPALRPRVDFVAGNLQ